MCKYCENGKINQFGEEWYSELPFVSKDGLIHKILRESISSTYHYDDFAVDTRADWSLPQTFPFKAICRVDFDEASVVVENDVLSVYKDDESFSESFDPEDAFVYELKAFIEHVISSKPCDVTSPESVSDSVNMALKEIQSAQKGEEVVI